MTAHRTIKCDDVENAIKGLTDDNIRVFLDGLQTIVLLEFAQHLDIKDIDLNVESREDIVSEIIRMLVNTGYRFTFDMKLDVRYNSEKDNCYFQIKDSEKDNIVVASECFLDRPTAIRAGKERIKKLIEKKLLDEL